MSEVFDTSSFDGEFASAVVEEKFDPMYGGESQSGAATIMVNNLWMSKKEGDDSGTLRVNLKGTLLDGPQRGKTVFKSYRLVQGDKNTATAVRVLKTDLSIMGLKMGALSELNDENTTAKVKGKTLGVTIKVTDPAKGFYDIRINRVVS